jgi:hypothetical protein
MQRFSNTTATTIAITAITIATTATTHNAPLPPTQPHVQARNIYSKITYELPENVIYILF